ncbi:MAG: type I secretion system permease/ATPase [Betaproteobacteria bacterium]|nr:type I secretion system permease/ATPase [Betaproteobacteria bacterium]
MIRRFKSFLLHAWLFSLALNLLLLVPSLFMLQVFDRVLTSRHEETLLMLLLITTVALLVMVALDVVRSRLLNSMGVVLDEQLGPRLLRSMLDDASRPGVSAPMHGLRDLAVLRAALSGQAVLAVLDAPWLLVYLAIVFLFHPVMGLVALGGAALLGVLAMINEKRTHKLVESIQLETRGASRYLDSILRNSEVIGALGMVPQVTQRWAGLNQAVLVKQYRASERGGLYTGWTRFSRQLIQVLMMAVGAWLVIDQHATPGVMIAATIILGRALAPVEALVAGWKGLVEAQSAYRRVQPLLEADENRVAETELPAPEGRFAMEGVSFAPTHGSRAILRGVSLELTPGDILAVIGPSASGKSTLARVAIGLWRAQMGTVRLDGADIARWNRDRLGQYIGYLPQDVELFSGTVAENIARMAGADGKLDSAEVIRAAQRAHAHEMILRLAEGYDTQIGEGGAILSGGQRQRVALARALFGDPRFVVLDEPNANLDMEGEQALMACLAGLKRDRVTVIAVTQRTRLLAASDRILMMRDGMVERFGTRQEVEAWLRSQRPAPAARVAGTGTGPRPVPVAAEQGAAAVPPAEV